MSLQDLGNRLLWTVVAAVGAAAPVAALLDVSAWKAAVFAGATSAINLVTLVARRKLAELPEL